MGKDKVRLSNTRINLYNECGAKYKFRYVDRLTSYDLNSPLIFGAALDEALNYLLECKRDGVEFDKKKCIEIFSHELEFGRGDTSLKEDMNVVYYNSDLAVHLLTDDIIDYLVGLDEGVSKIKDWSLKEQQEYVKDLKTNTPELFNYLGWQSLYQKGLLMIDTYIDEIYDLIDEVNEVQDTRLVTNNEGDELIFITDFTATLKGDTIHRKDVKELYVSESVLKKVGKNDKCSIVFDNKSTSKPYQLNSVSESVQLSTYSEYYDTDYAGYVTLNKKIGKNRKVKWQMIIDEVPKDFQAEHFAVIQETLQNIKEGEFPKNEDACFNYGRRCEYYHYCKFGKMDNLYVREKK